MKRFLAGSALLALTGALNGCSPVMVASRPRPVIYDPAPAPVAVVPVAQPVPVVQVAQVVPVVPVWAPPYTYVHEVHYYYFPDYLVYYDVLASNYCYFNGYSWIQVTVLPALPAYYGFNPALAYLVVLNRNVYQPWTHHVHYHDLYPSHYYQTAYRPRSAPGANVMLRAYDENQSRALYVDRKTNKEVRVPYETTQVRTPAGSTTVTPGATPRRAETVQPAVKQDRSRQTVNPVQSESAHRQEAGTTVKDSRREIPVRNYTPPADTREINRGVRAPVNTPTDRQRAAGREEGRAIVQADKNRTSTSQAPAARSTRQENQVREATTRSTTGKNGSSAEVSNGRAADESKGRVAADAAKSRSESSAGTARQQSGRKSDARDSKKSR